MLRRFPLSRHINFVGVVLDFFPWQTCFICGSS